MRVGAHFVEGNNIILCHDIWEAILNENQQKSMIYGNIFVNSKMVCREYSLILNYILAVCRIFMIT